MNITIPENLYDLSYNYLDIPLMAIEHEIFNEILYDVEFNIDRKLPRLEDTIITTIRIHEYGHTFLV